jgi:hypothetical protein
MNDEMPKKPKNAYVIRINHVITFEFDTEKGYDYSFVSMFVCGLISAFKKDYEMPHPDLPAPQARGERTGQYLKIHAQRWGIKRHKLLEMTITFKGEKMPWTEFLHDKRSNKYRERCTSIQEKHTV